MAELRKKVLRSKPFANLSSPQTCNDFGLSKSAVSERSGQHLEEDSDQLSDSELGDNVEFDNIFNATPVFDRSGIASKQKANALDRSTASFSRTQLIAPKRR